MDQIATLPRGALFRVLAHAALRWLLQLRMACHCHCFNVLSIYMRCVLYPLPYTLALPAMAGW